MSVLEKIRKLEEQKASLLSEAKKEALAKANEAVKELNELGFNYQLVQGETGGVTRSPTGRRSGIRNEVLKVVTDASPDGIAPAGIRDKLGLTDTSGAQSVANALSALKKANKIADKNGLYVSA